MENAGQPLSQFVDSSFQIRVCILLLVTDNIFKLNQIKHSNFIVILMFKERLQSFSSYNMKEWSQI